MNTKLFFGLIIAWQDKTFTQATAQSACEHLKEEVNELLEDVLYDKESAKEEWADCALLLIGIAHKLGMSADDCYEALCNKMEKNLNRKWGEPNQQGYVKHVEP
jgi:NTP pyrophosphatase (non-canonical NTP hydrolase)